MISSYVWTLGRYFFFFFLSVLFSTQSYGQSTKECEQVLRSSFQKFVAFATRPEPGRIFYMRYTLKTRMRDTAMGRDNETTVDLTVSSSFLRYRSDEMEVYQDDEVSFTVLPKNNTIYIRDVVPQNSSDQLKNLLLLQDSLLKFCSITSCRDVKKHDALCKEITLTPDRAAQKFIPLSRVRYVINPIQKSFLTIFMEYTTKSPVASIEMIIHDFNENYTDKVVSQDVRKQFLRGNKLTERYKKYKLVDLRTTTGK